MVGWTPDGKILYATRRYSTLPDTQLATIDSDNRVDLIPLSQAAQGSYDATGANLFFTRLPFQGSFAKRYQGGTAQNLWKYTAGREATPLTADFAGTSKDAMWWKGRVYFLSDRDGTMNLWSVDENGKDLKQHTRHQGLDLKDPFALRGPDRLSDGRRSAAVRHRLRRTGDPDRPGLRLRSSARALDQESRTTTSPPRISRRTAAAWC